MYCELKKGEYWIWSSRIASLDCLPQYKLKTIKQLNDKILSISESKVKAIKQRKIDKKKARQRKEYEKSQQMRGERLYSWATNLN
jgi:hypothetical protein